MVHKIPAANRSEIADKSLRQFNFANVGQFLKLVAGVSLCRKERSETCIPDAHLVIQRYGVFAL